MPPSALSVRNNLLRENGWSSDEIARFEIWQDRIHKFIHYVIDFVIEIIIYRYHKFLIGHEINDYADKFILNFIENKASFFIKKKIELLNKEYGIYTDDKDYKNNIAVKRYEENEFQNIIFQEKHKEALFGKFGDLILPNLDNNKIKDLLQKISQDIIFMIDVGIKYFETELDEMEKDNKLVQEGFFDDEKKNQSIKFYKSSLI